MRFVNCAKNLGVILDAELSFEQQIMDTVKSCFFTIQKLSKIKSFLSSEHLKTLVSACIFSKIDYCNSLHYGMNMQLLRKLQSVQNASIRLIRKRDNFSHMSTWFHWLPVHQKIIFKLLLIVRKCLNGNAPIPLCQLLEYSSSDRTLKLKQVRCNSEYGRRAFSVAGPKLWNLLPEYIRKERDIEKFKGLLKTTLFKEFDSFLCRIKDC